MKLVKALIFGIVISCIAAKSWAVDSSFQFVPPVDAPARAFGFERGSPCKLGERPGEVYRYGVLTLNVAVSGLYQFNFMDELVITGSPWGEAGIYNKPVNFDDLLVNCVASFSMRSQPGDAVHLDQGPHTIVLAYIAERNFKSIPVYVSGPAAVTINVSSEQKSTTAVPVNGLMTLIIGASGILLTAFMMFRSRRFKFL